MKDLQTFHSNHYWDLHLGMSSHILDQKIGQLIEVVYIFYKSSSQPNQFNTIKYNCEIFFYFLRFDFENITSGIS